MYRAGACGLPLICRRAGLGRFTVFTASSTLGACSSKAAAPRLGYTGPWTRRRRAMRSGSRGGPPHGIKPSVTYADHPLSYQPIWST
jgi:hypothetical protein